MLNLDNYEAAEELRADEVAIIFGFLPCTDIMRARVCSTWREAAKKTLVPLSKFDVDSVRTYNAMRVMSTALPNLQQMSLLNLRGRHTYSHGNDADEWPAVTANYTIHDINIVSNFRMLRELSIHDAPLNGRYPVLFDFPLLRLLSIHECGHLKFDLKMLGGLPSLEELECSYNPCFTGNVNRMRALKDTLVKVTIVGSAKIRGNFIDLADFPFLRELNLLGTAVTGDIREISGSNFPALQDIVLPETVAGGSGYEFQLISEVPSIMHAIHLLTQRNIMQFREGYYWRSRRWALSRNSPDWYALYDDLRPILAPPFKLQIIRAGSRLGWSWYSSGWDNNLGDEVNLGCEVNWLDAEPSSESSDYENYVGALQLLRTIGILGTDFYRGYYEPPIEQEYLRLCERVRAPFWLDE